MEEDGWIIDDFLIATHNIVEKVPEQKTEEKDVKP